MSKSYSIAEARDRFASIVHDVERDSAIELTRRGKPVAVLLSAEEYHRLLARGKSFWDAYSSFVERTEPENLGIQAETFEGLRDDSPGREAGW